MTSALRRVTASAPAKTNLLLHVGSPTPDGYHPLETLFVAVDLRETVTATLDPASAGAAVSVTVEPAPGSEYARMVQQGAVALSDIPLDERNLAVRAALAVCDAVDVPVPALALHVRKAVPVAGGMGGGSADAAAALVAVNELLAAHLGTAPLAPGELSRLGARLGADVPFMLLGGAALGRGTGTELEPVPTSAQLHLVFVPQDRGLSTPAVYRRWDDSHGRSGTGAPDPVPAQALAALDPADPETLAPLVRNDLQPPAVDLLPALAGVLDHGVELGALTGWVSGSGPTVCFLARSADAAEQLVRAFSHEGRRALATAAPVPGARVDARG